MFFCRDKDRNTAFVTREKECAIERNKLFVQERLSLVYISAPETDASSEGSLQTESIVT